MNTIFSQTLSIVLLVNLANGIAVGAAQELDPDEFNSRKASAAVKSYVRAIEKARIEFAKTEQKAREELTESLEDALKQETQEGHLEEALKLKQTMDSLKSTSAKPSGTTTAADYVGLWKITFTNGATRYYAVKFTGNTIVVHFLKEKDSQNGRQAKVKFADGSLLLDFSDQKLDRLNYSNGRLYIEHWDFTRVKDKQAFPSGMAIGVRVNE